MQYVDIIYPEKKYVENACKDGRVLISRYTDPCGCGVRVVVFQSYEDAEYVYEQQDENFDNNGEYFWPKSVSEVWKHARRGDVVEIEDLGHADED